MSEFEKLRGDHLLLMVLAENLSRLTSQEEIPCKVELFHVRTKLASILIRHLKQEDWVVYPSLLRCADLSRREAAQALQRQTGSLATAFSAYMQRWTTLAIQRDWPSYRVETAAILNVLERRIADEDTHLYGEAANDGGRIELSRQVGT